MSPKSTQVDEFNTRTVSAFAELWAANTLANLSRLRSAPSLSELRNIYAGKAAICAGAGPSLSQNIDELQNTSAPIIAVETCSPLLLERDIQPSFVVVNDPNERIARHFANVDTGNLRLIAPYFVHPAVLEAFRGEVYFFAPKAPIAVFALCERVIGDIGGLPSGSCVGHAANYVAAYLGASAIINVGQDLSYPGGNRYAAGITEIDENVGGEKITMLDIDGNPVTTDERMLSYKEIFETAVPHYCKGVTFVNATEGGILELGEQMTLKEALSVLGNQ